MINTTAKYWQTTALLVILFIITIYILFVSILSKEVTILHYNPPAIAYELPTQQLTKVDDYISNLLLIDSLAKDTKQKLVVKIAETQGNWLVVPLNHVLTNMILAVFYPALALLMVAFIAAFLILNYQQSKLISICTIADNIATTFGQQKSYKQEYSVLANLNYALEDIARYAAQYRIETEQSAFCDKLTQLTNRHSFLEHIEEQLTLDQTINSGLLFIDLDGFKQVNDSFGHSFGDEILIQVAERLRSIVRSNKLNFTAANSGLEKNLARLGGDEFTIFLYDIENSAYAVSIAKYVLSELERDFILGNKTIKISASVGIALYPESANKPNALVQLADVAMYRA